MSTIVAGPIGGVWQRTASVSRRRWVLTAITVAAATAIAGVAFVYRFNTPQGSLGGFTNDHFAHLMRVEMLMRGQQPLRDFADAELRGAWPALSYAASAWAQQIGGRTLLPEAYLTLGALAIAHMLTFLVALHVSTRWSVALLAAAVAVITGPRAYSYPKVLMLAAGATVLTAAMSNPSTVRLGIAAIVTAIATLFRHDCGVYVGLPMIAGLVAHDQADWRQTMRRVGVYTGCTAVLLLPSAVWVQTYAGVGSYLRAALATAAREAERTKLELPVLVPESILTADGLLTLTYFAFWTILPVAVIVLIWRGRGEPPLAAKARAMGIGLVVMTALANHFLLRGSLSQRLGDAVVPVVLLAAWSSGAAAGIAHNVARRLAWALPVGLMVFMFGATWVFAGVTRQLEDSGLVDSWDGAADQFMSVRDSLRTLPPVTWSEEDAHGPLPQAARYVAQCTSPDDYLMVAAEAPEIYVFARRRFAAGQPTVALGLYSSESDQRRAIARLAQQSVPIILVDAGGFAEFASTYRLLGQHLAEHYRRAGIIDGRFLVFVEVDRHADGVDAYSGLPCFQ